jgi:hypothetical protein
MSSRTLALVIFESRTNPGAYSSSSAAGKLRKHQRETSKGSGVNGTKLSRICLILQAFA